MVVGVSGKIGSGKDLTGDIIKYLDSKSTKNFKDWSTEHIHNGYDISGKSMYGIDYEKDNRWQIKKFADKLKDIVCLLLNCTREQLEDRNFKEKELGEEWWLWEIEGYNSERYIYKTKQEALESQGGYYQPKLVKLTPRKLLQLLGTDCGRDIIHPNIWVNSLMMEYKEELQNMPYSDELLKKENWTEAVLPNWIITDMRFPNEMQAVKDRGGITIRINRHWYDFCQKQINANEKVVEHESETALDNAEFDYVVENNGSIEDLIEKIKEIMIKEKLI